ncbi:MAG: cupin domain-containing protein [Pseudomonadota bacterium]
MTADEIIATLKLEPHPEGGFYAPTWVADGPGRAAGTAIYYLLRGADPHRWHKIDSAEIWHYYAGAPLVLSIAETEEGPARDLILGPDILSGARPQIIIPPWHWQVARSTGDWTLVGCTVSPGFEFQHFTLASEDFDIPR